MWCPERILGGTARITTDYLWSFSAAWGIDTIRLRSYFADMDQTSKTITELMNEEERVREAVLCLLRDIEKLERVQRTSLVKTLFQTASPRWR
jgi:hypothetical protein